MNKTKIEWADMTYNPVVGCGHNCEYCYARRIANRFGGFDLEDSSPKEICTTLSISLHELRRPLKVMRRGGRLADASYPYGFEPTFFKYKLLEPQGTKTPQNIFVCSMADLFGDWVPDSWIEEVFAACKKAPQHRYLFLTKNPQRYGKLAGIGRLPVKDNMWYGTTITGPGWMLVSEKYNTFVSIEPLMEPPGGKEGRLFFDKAIRWIIVGAMTGPGSKDHQPEKSWVDEITSAADKAGIPVFMKDSLIPIVGEENMRREFPWKT